MKTISGVTRFFLVVACACAAFGVGLAKDHSELIAALDDIDRTIKDSKTVAERSAETLEELRRELYRSAIQTRDAKRLAGEIEKAIDAGDDVTAELLSLKKDIVNAGVILRDVNNLQKRLAGIATSNREQLNEIEQDVDQLKLGLVDPEDARKAAGRRLVARLEKQLEEANDLAEQRGRIIEQLNRQLEGARSAGGGDADTFTSLPFVDPKIAEAEELLHDGEIEKALVLFKEIIYERPDSDRARLGLAASYFERGDSELARRMIEEVLNRDKSNAAAMGLMGALHYSEGDLRKARRILEKAVGLDESNARNLNYLGAVLFAMDRQEEGIEKVRAAIALDPTLIAAHYNLAVMLLSAEEQDLTAAGVHYRRAIELGSPRDPMIDQILGLAAETEGE